MKRKVIQEKLVPELGILSTLTIMSILYPKRYGHGKGMPIKFRRLK